MTTKLLSDRFNLFRIIRALGTSKKCLLDTEDGIYVEVTEDEPYCTRDSKVYIIQDGEVIYEEVLSEYGCEFEDYFE